MPRTSLPLPGGFVGPLCALALFGWVPALTCSCCLSQRAPMRRPEITNRHALPVTGTPMRASVPTGPSTGEVSTALCWCFASLLVSRGGLGMRRELMPGLGGSFRGARGVSGGGARERGESRRRKSRKDNRGVERRDLQRGHR